MLDALQNRVEAVEDRLNAVLPAPLKVGFLTLYWYSTRSSRRLDSIASRPAVRRWSDVSIGVLLLVQVAGLALVTVAAIDALGQTSTTALNNPVNTVAIPGLNDFMPLAATPYIVFALVVATIVHEGGHALACRAEDVPIQEWGLALLLGVVPLAGYVLPDERLDDAPTRTKMRVFAIGVFHNLLVGLVAFGILLLPLTVSPIEAFRTYFGWAVLGGTPPTAATVASLGVVGNLCFWLALLNANFGLLNALPISVLDGGHVLSLSLDAIAKRGGYTLSTRHRTLVVNLASVVVVGLVAVAIVGPYLWT